MPPPSVATATATARPPPRTAPSGIAQQLRKSSEQHAQVPQQQLQPQSDPMNLDDFIFPSSVASPAGLSPDPSTDMAAVPSHATAPSILIRKPNQANDHNLSLAHASAPPVPPAINRENEFGYVHRHVRKTSIDERRVSCLSPSTTMSLYIPTDTLSASEAACRGLTTSPACQQHHDPHRCAGRSRSQSVFSRPLHAAAHLPCLASQCTLLDRYIPDARGSYGQLCRPFSAELWLFSCRLAHDEPQRILHQHVQRYLYGIFPQLDRLLLST